MYFSQCNQEGGFLSFKTNWTEPGIPGEPVVPMIVCSYGVAESIQSVNCFPYFSVTVFKILFSKNWNLEPVPACLPALMFAVYDWIRYIRGLLTCISKRILPISCKESQLCVQPFKPHLPTLDNVIVTGFKALDLGTLLCLSWPCCPLVQIRDFSDLPCN